MGLRSAPPVRVDVLGPLRLTVDGAPVAVRGAKRRAMLAMLTLAEGRTVTVDHLIDELWPPESTDSGRQAVHSLVFRLRENLAAAADLLQTRADGYRLELDAGALDLARARSLLAAGRAKAEAEPATAAGLLRDAHDLWRGPVLADLADFLSVATAIEQCARLHRDVTDALITTAIDAGQAPEVLALAVTSVAADPLREPAVRSLMRALAATGQAAEALRTGREFRRRLADDTGLDASPELDALERTIAGGGAGPPSRRADVRVTPPAPLIGRDAEVAALHRLLGTERLVTLVGAGGVGKTRLAVEVARRSGPTTTLLLAPVTDPTALPHVLAEALDLTVVQGDVLAACLAVLGDRPGLLVIDNCEHLLDEVRDTVNRILSSCPDLTVLTTSREPLGLAAEYAFRLSPLPVPGPGQDVARVPSAAIFLDRAARVRPGPSPGPAELQAVAEIVRRLDGMPLAIELAAGRLSTFALDDLLLRLDRSLDLLGSARPSADARHRTLRATLEWSYRLLPQDERRLFRHLAVFVDGIDLDSAERLAGQLGLDGEPGAVLAHLVDASMIDAHFEGGTRYRMLETLRAFGLDRLAAAGEDRSAADLLVRWAVDLTQWVERTMAGEDEPTADGVLRRELANLRAAWRLTRDRGSVDDAAAIVTALYDAVGYRDLIEIRGWAEELAGDPVVLAGPHAAAVLGVAAEAAYHRGDYALAERRALAGLDEPDAGGGAWFCLSALSVAELARGAFTEVERHSLAAADLATRPRENLGVAALAAAYSGDVDRASTLNASHSTAGPSPSMRSWRAYVNGEIEAAAGRPDAAERHYALAVELAGSSGATFLVGIARVGLIAAWARTGRIQEALDGYRAVIDYFSRTGNWTHLWVTLRNLAELLRGLGESAAADRIAAAADRAPDAPAVGAQTGDGSPDTGTAGSIPSRSDVLDTARRAIERSLGGL